MPGAIKRESNQFLVLFALWLLVFSAGSQLMIVVAMLPVIGRQLQIPEAGQGWLVSVYAPRSRSPPRSLTEILSKNKL